MPIVAFTATGSHSWTVPAGVSIIEVLVVAGGGGGGVYRGGGGGAGGLIHDASFAVTPESSIPIAVGSGGVGGNKGHALQGDDSTFGSLSAIGGGKGGFGNNNQGLGGNGGSGGGGGGENAFRNGGTGVHGQGQYGGSNTNGSSDINRRGGGGGGAGGVGGHASGLGGGDGGVGVFVPTFASYGHGGYFSGGGGGSSGLTSDVQGLGGGGGGGAANATGNAEQGLVNTGGGGGGAGGGFNSANIGGDGGSGVVLVYYEDSVSGDIGEGNLVEITQEVIDATDVVGEGDLITISQVVNITASGNVVSVSQTVGLFGAGNLTKLEQAVDLRLTGKGGLVALGQTVNATTTAGQGNLTRIAQSVRATVAPTEYEPPFDLELIVGELTTPCDQIHGSISITRSESSAALMDVTLIPTNGAQNITQYQGKDIILNYIEGGQSTRIYTGKVDIPEVDLIGQTITLRCTDNRTEQNNGLDPVFVEGIGQYSEAVFGEAKDQNDEIEKRLQTVQASLDYDANGLVTYTQWQPKATADFTFDDPDIYRRTPQVEVLSRGRVINQVNLDITYRWVRLRHRERSWSWSYPFNANSWCGFLVDNIGLCPVDAPRRAAEGAGWAIKPDSYQTEPLPPSKWYRCTIGNLVNRPIGWQTSKRSCTFTDKLDDEGNAIKDSEGKTVQVEDGCSIVDSQNAFAIAADWTAAKRWAQTVEQVSQYIITAPQSIAQYGVVERDQRVGTESEHDATTWEAMRNYQAPTGTKSANGDWVTDKLNEGQGEFNAAVSCVTAKAVADILGSHRQNYVTLQLPFQRSIDLRHTIETTAGKIQCKGKAYSIRHTLDVGDKFAETEIQIALSRSTGSASDSLPAISLSPATDQPQTEPQTFRLGNWIGGRAPNNLIGWTGFGQSGQLNSADASDAGLPKGAQGFITNYKYNRPRPLFTESFIVDTPAIEDSARDTMTAEAEQTATVAIRNDHLEVVFDE